MSGLGAPMTCPLPPLGWLSWEREIPAPQWAQRGLGRLTTCVCVVGVVLDCPEGRWGLAARRSARHVSTVPPVCRRLEPACAAPASRAAAARMVSARYPPPQPCPQSQLAPCPAPAMLSLSLPTACPAGWFGPSCQLAVLLCRRWALPPSDRQCSCAPGWTRPQLPER